MNKTGLLFLLAILVACTEKKVDTKAEGEKLMALSREWSKSAATDSLEKTLSYWADDAVLMSPGQPALQGKEAIRKMLEGTFKIPGFKVSWDPVSAQVSKSGDMAYLIEKGQVTMSDSWVIRLPNTIILYPFGEKTPMDAGKMWRIFQLLSQF